MNKQALVEAVCSKLEADLVAMKEAARATYDAATNEESTPENEYDTRALEASYLAGAQAKRVLEIERQLLALRKIEIKTFSENDPADITALIDVEHNGKSQTFFLMPGGGGISLSQNGKSVQVISPTSPLGQSLIGTRKGDDVVVEIGSKTQEYEILKIA